MLLDIECTIIGNGFVSIVILLSNVAEFAVVKCHCIPACGSSGD